jgi:hypothetical protein
MARASFVIDGTEFGIDRARSTFEITRSDAGETLLDAQTVGDQETYDALTAGLPDETDDEHDARPWSWTLYPPELYVRACPVVRGPDETHSATVSIDDLDDVEVGIYLMSHHDVDDVNITMTSDGFVATGTVWIDRRELTFSIALTNE